LPGLQQPRVPASHAGPAPYRRGRTVR
jgi:hypothetical protein